MSSATSLAVLSRAKAAEASGDEAVRAGERPDEPRADADPAREPDAAARAGAPKDVAGEISGPRDRFGTYRE